MPKEPDTIEDLPSPAAEGGKKGGGGNPFIVIIANVILIPVLTVVLFEFYIFPKIKTLQSGEGHAEVAASHEPAGGGGGEHGGGGGGGEHGGGQTYEFANIVANLSGALQSRYVKVSFTVEGKAKDFQAKMQGNEAKLIDATLVTLSRLTLQDLEKPEIKNIIRANLLNEFGRVLNGNYVDQLYFSEFVVQ